ncbi:MAG: hypothetical protein ACREOE_17175, partial [Gemmatimonadales bacterium]
MTEAGHGEQASPLDQPQEFTDASSYQVREELAVFCPVDDPLDDLAALDGSPEDRHLRLLYRDELRHAIGRNVAAGVRRAGLIAISLGVAIGAAIALGVVLARFAIARFFFGPAAVNAQATIALAGQLLLV